MLVTWGNTQRVSLLTPPTITSANAANNVENTVLAFALTTNQTGVAWTLVGGADQARFEISGSTLRWAANGAKDFEAPNDANADNVYLVTVRATNLAGRTTDQNIAITVTDVSEGAVIGHELITVGDGSNTGGYWTLVHVSALTQYHFVFISETPYMEATAAETLVPGVYRFIADDLDGKGSTMNVRVGGTDEAIISNEVTLNGTITVVSVTDQLIRITDDVGDNYIIDNLSLKRES